ncbi:MAG: TonB-dependent receptor [Bacteroidales bacterium]|nr:TonB-dependent receptor [Bacteroidales bacterium]
MKLRLIEIEIIGLLNCFFFLSIIVSAQPPGSQGRNMQNMPAEGKLIGKVIDAKINEPMEYSNVVLYSLRDSSIVTGTVTDPHGNFKMENLRYGRFYAIANFIGYNKKVIENITINPKQQVVDLGIVYLEPAATNLEGVEVVADKQHVEFKIDKKIVNVSQDLVGSTGSAVSILENVPSVQVDIEGNVSLRGTENFQVLVDGKPSIIQGSDALQQIPASTIDHIEIITNPSAKYDPDGVGGIINVVLKKQKQSGLTGVVNASIATGDKYSTDFVLNYRTSRFNFFAGAEVNSRYFKMEGNSNYETYFEDSTSYQDAFRNGKMHRTGYDIRGGLDFYLDDKTTLTLEGNFGNYGFGRNMTSSRHIYTIPESIDEYSQSVSESERGGNFYRTNLNLLHKFDDKGHKIEALVDYSTSKTDDWETQHDYLTDPYWNINYDSIPESIKTNEDENDLDIRLKADYTKPIGADGKLEAGYQSRFNLENEIFTFQDYDPVTGDWIQDDKFSSEVDFKRNIHSVYAIYSNVWGSFGYQLGLRGEYTDRKIENVDTADAYVINRFDYFPSIHLSKEFEGGHQILVSYSRRIDRPGGRELDPVPNYMDPYNIWVGNPALEPEYIDSYELGYQKRFEKSFISLEGYYRINKNKITRVKTLRDDGIFIHTHQNLNKDFSLGAELMVNLDITKWLLFNGSVNVYNYRLEGNVEDVDVSKESTNWDSRGNVTLKFRHDIRVQLTGNYRGPSVTAQGERKGFMMTDAAVRKDFLDKKLSVTLSVRDIFSTAKREYITHGASFYSYDYFTREAPVFTINLTYLINNYKKQRNQNGDMENSGGEGGDMDF